VYDGWARLEEVTKDGRYNLAGISPVGVLGDPTKAGAEAGYASQDAADGVYMEIVGDTLRGYDGASRS
jgi:hypothetical protein